MHKELDKEENELFFGKHIAVASGMTYRMIKGSDAANGRYHPILTNPVSPAPSHLISPSS